MTSTRLFVGLSALCALLVVPAAAEAQRRYPPTRYESWRDRDTRREATLAVGVFDYDVADDQTFPMAALRVDWRLTRYLRAEFSAAYATGDVEDGVGTDDDIRTSLGAATVGLRAELPWPYIRPYVGAAGGLFGRYDEEGGDRFVRPTHAFPVGVRIPLSDRLALRGEVRFRFDEHQGGGTAVNAEQSAGLSFVF